MYRRERTWPGLLLCIFLQWMSHNNPQQCLPTIEQNELIQAQKDDPVISQVRQWKEDGVTLTDEMRAGLTGTSRKLMYEWNKLHLEGGTPIPQNK